MYMAQKNEIGFRITILNLMQLFFIILLESEMSFANINKCASISFEVKCIFYILFSQLKVGWATDMFKSSFCHR